MQLVPCRGVESRTERKCACGQRQPHARSLESGRPWGMACGARPRGDFLQVQAPRHGIVKKRPRRRPGFVRRPQRLPGQGDSREGSGEGCLRPKPLYRWQNEPGWENEWIALIVAVTNAGFRRRNLLSERTAACFQVAPKCSFLLQLYGTGWWNVRV